MWSVIRVIPGDRLHAVSIHSEGSGFMWEGGDWKNSKNTKKKTPDLGPFILSSCVQMQRISTNRAFDKSSNASARKMKYRSGWVRSVSVVRHNRFLQYSYFKCVSEIWSIIIFRRTRIFENFPFYQLTMRIHSKNHIWKKNENFIRIYTVDRIAPTFMGYASPMEQ